MEKKIKIICPLCGAEMLKKEWWDDHGLEERLKECPQCDYIYHWAYGRIVADSEADKLDDIDIPF